MRESLDQETWEQQQIRERVFPLLPTFKDAPKNAGKHEASIADLELVHRGLLFNGAVEAGFGDLVVHDSLALTIYQIGVSLVSYRGDQGTWRQRLFRRDLREHHEDALEELLTVLQGRERLAGADDGDAVGELVQRALLTYASALSCCGIRKLFGGWEKATRFPMSC